MNDLSRCNVSQSSLALIDHNGAARTLEGWESGALCINTTYAAGDVTYTLPDGGAAIPAGNVAGAWFEFVKTHATNNIFVVPAAGDTIVTASNVPITQIPMFQFGDRFSVLHVGSGKWVLRQETRVIVAAPIVTASAVVGGAAVTGSINIGCNLGSLRLQISARSETYSTRVYLWADGAHTIGPIMLLEANPPLPPDFEDGIDCYTSPYADTSVLTGLNTLGVVYYQVYNLTPNGLVGNDSIYDITVTCEGKL